MLNYQQISTELSRLLKKAYPDCSVNVNYLPQDAQFPCFLVQAVATDIQDATCTLVSITEYITLTCLVAADATNKQDQLADMQLGVLNLFRQGFITVSDRAISVRASTGGQDQNSAYIELQCSYEDIRTDPIEEPPKMMEANINFKGV